MPNPYYKQELAIDIIKDCSMLTESVIRCFLEDRDKDDFNRLTRSIAHLEITLEKLRIECDYSALQREFF